MGIPRFSMFLPAPILSTLLLLYLLLPSTRRFMTHEQKNL